jgi:uncharacterized protein YcaQ
MTSKALDKLRTHARRATMFRATTLNDAIHRLGFVQADPIRAPARAQDLILRHRVAGYRAGDLERGFKRLNLDEDFLYAHGFMPAETARLFHPRVDPDSDLGGLLPSGLAADVLAFVRENAATHPADLAKKFGRDRAENNWGGFSKATTQALHGLHHAGLLRVAHRRGGIRVYEATTAAEPIVDPRERAKQLVMLVARILAPVSPVSLRGALSLMARRNPALGKLAPVLDDIIRAGALARETIDDETYLWPAADDGARGKPAPRDVRLLAPFDPIVWDRRRFAHLWGWAYRFEAYTKPRLRAFGYYAMPLLWGDDVIGWANIRRVAATMDVATGYVGRAPKSLEFRRALDAELARMERFLTSPGVDNRAARSVI